MAFYMALGQSAATYRPALGSNVESVELKRRHAGKTMRCAPRIMTKDVAQIVKTNIVAADIVKNNDVALTGLAGKIIMSMTGPRF